MQQSLIEGLLREARLFSHLKHRNIIQLLGVSPSLSTRNLYLVMEYAHGGALSYLLQQRQSGLYPTVFIEYAKQIADGMNYLHEEACEQRIIHRDLKCSNSKTFCRNTDETIVCFMFKFSSWNRLMIFMMIKIYRRKH